MVFEAAGIHDRVLTDKQYMKNVQYKGVDELLKGGYTSFQQMGQRNPHQEEQQRQEQAQQESHRLERSETEWDEESGWNWEEDSGEVNIHQLLGMESREDTLVHWCLLAT